MRQLQNWKIGKRISFGFGVAMFFLLALAVVVVVVNIRALDSVNRIDRESSLQVAVNDILDGFNAAQIEANTLYYVMRDEANQTFAHSAGETEQQFAAVLDSLAEDSILAEFQPGLRQAYEDYLAWGKAVDVIIAHNESLTGYRALLYENGTRLAEVSLDFLDRQLRDAGEQVILANRIKDQITAYRLDMRAVVETLDLSGIDVTLAYLDTAIQLAEQYQQADLSVQDRESMGLVTEIVRQNREITQAFAEEGGERAVAVQTAILLGGTANTTLQGALQELDEAVKAQVLLTEYRARRALWAVPLIAVVSILVAAVSIILIVRSITRPVKEIVDAAEAIAVGDTGVVVHYEAADELGDLARAFRRMMAATAQQIEYTRALSQGDFSLAVEVRSAHDDMSMAIKEMVERFNETFQEIRSSAEQVFAGSQEIAQASQNLATGATEQAATVEQFSAAIGEVQRITEQNSVSATQALTDVGQTSQLMEQCQEAMAQMMQAMQQISSTSQSISRVIKVIDDIAFQTNILALNAAVEAARAGQHGRGFGVVASEVRNLASKSAQAARETAELIEGSMASVEHGNQIVDQVNESIQTVGKITADNLTAISHIQEASVQQSLSMQEITAGVAQISQVVQDNSATAQETAAFSQEMAAQATALDRVLARFQLQGTTKITSPEAPQLPESGILLDFHSGQSIPQFGQKGKY